MMILHSQHILELSEFHTPVHGVTCLAATETHESAIPAVILEQFGMIFGRILLPQHFQPTLPIVSVVELLHHFGAGEIR